MVLAFQQAPVRIFLDFEFNNKGIGREIDPISIGLVSEDRAQRYYGVSCEFNEAAAFDASPFMREQVVQKLPPRLEWKPLDTIATEVAAFLSEERQLREGSPSLELWAKNGSFDFTLFSLLFGDDLMHARKVVTAQCGFARLDFRDTNELRRALDFPDDLPTIPAAEEHISVNDADLDALHFSIMRQRLIGTPAFDVLKLS